MAAVVSSSADPSTASESDQNPSDFKDPLGVKDPLTSALEEESDEYDFEYYLSQISPTSTRNLDLSYDQNNGQCSFRSMKKGTDDEGLESDERDLFVIVDNPEKHTSTMESYITFRITAKTTRSEFDSQEYQVRRRYNDFIWLRQRLEESHPTHLVPPLPEKHSLRRFDRFNQEFVKTRMVALQNFLQRIADHPVLSFNKHYYTFLTAKQWEFQSAKKEGAGIITRLADSFHNMSASIMIKNRSPEFSDITNYIFTFGEKLGTMERISQRIAKEECDLLAELNDWGPIFTLWSNSEEKLSGALSGMAKSVEKCYVSLQELVDASDVHFGNRVKEYILYTEAIKGVLRKRDAIQMEYDMILDELNRKKEEKDQANDDIAKLSRQVEVLNDKVTCANADLKADLERWHKNKRQDFHKLFVEMADRQISYYQKCLEAWEEAILKIQKSDLESEEIPAALTN